MTVNPKSLSGGQTSSAKSAVKTSKKIDLGAAANFGRDEIGINSPTHRHTHAEEDLFDSLPSTANKADDLLDDIFKTCSSNDSVTTATVVETSADDDFFNPRADETNEFGDFASAFGGAATIITSQPSAAQPVAAATNVPASLSLSGASDSKNCDFADFSAFDGSESTNTTTIQDSDNLLFSMNASNSNAQTTTLPTLPAASNSNQRAGDLLSDLDGLSLNVPVPIGEWSKRIFFLWLAFNSGFGPKSGIFLFSSR